MPDVGAPEPRCGREIALKKLLLATGHWVELSVYDDLICGTVDLQWIAAPDNEISIEPRCKQSRRATKTSAGKLVMAEIAA